MTDEIDKIVATINAQKGELMGINAFLGGNGTLANTCGTWEASRRVR